MYSKFAIYFFWLAAVFDPIGSFYGMRYVALGLISIALLASVFAATDSISIGPNYLWIFCYFVFLIPFWGMAVGLIRGGVGREYIDTSYIASAVYFSCSLVYFLKNKIVAGFGAQILALRLLCAAILFCFLLTVSGSSLDLVYLFVANGAAFYGERVYGGVGFFYIYFIASPMLIFLLAYESWRFLERPSIRSILFLMLPVVSLFLTGTRFNIIAAVIGLPFVFMWRRFGVNSILLFGGLIVAVTFIALPAIELGAAKSMFDVDEGSNSEKIGYLRGYLEIFSDPATILVGQGFNAHEWSPSFARILGEGASKTELTYLEFARVFGFLGLLSLLFVLFRMVVWFDDANSSYRWVAPAMTVYIASSSLNPYLFSSNGILLLGFAAAIMGGAHLPGRSK